MKKIIALVSLLLLICSLFSACGEYVQGVSRPQNQTGNSVVATTPNGEIENPFTVCLTFTNSDGKVTYIPTAESPVEIQWSDGYSVHTAQLGPDGIARIGGLDGDYKVTVNNLPEGYTYNPNIYTADNNHRHVEIEMHQIVPTRGSGINEYSCISIRNTGVYCIEVKSADQVTYFEFAPSRSGTYSVQSWMDVTANEINPYAEYWGANAMWKKLQSTHDTGGPEGSYTKNFVMDVQIADENISSSGGGAAAFTFGVGATQKSGKYPIKIYIAITLDGEFSLDYTDAEIIVPTADLESIKTYLLGAGQQFTQGTFHWAETRQYSANSGTSGIFDGDNYKLWPKSQGGDDLYHKYDPAKYPSTGGYGPVLFAKITEACRFLENQSGKVALTQIEYAGNKALTVSNGTQNYKLFIEGWSYLNSTTLDVDPVYGKVPYFCDYYCPCREERTCTSYQLLGEVGTCTTGCTKCLPTCNQCPEEGIGHSGYAAYSLWEGCAPVTQELKEFLQKFAISRSLFMDGQGYVETYPEIQIFASEEDQWLFACGYFE